MINRPTDELIDLLSSNVKPVAPLAPPLARAGVTLGAMALLSGLTFMLLRESDPLQSRGPGGATLVVFEMSAMLMTGILAITGAFFLAVPGRSRYWLGAPLVPFAAWLLLSGAGCYRELVQNGPTGWELGHSANCFTFIVATSFLLGAPVVWRLSRAAPIDPLPVAALGGLGIAALAAFLLQFFHPFAVTLIDLAVHVAAIIIVVGLTALLKRPMLRPA
ncbi:MAG: NrsF family protein [Sphingomicrobium sp.]